MKVHFRGEGYIEEVSEEKAKELFYNQKETLLVFNFDVDILTSPCREIYPFYYETYSECIDGVNRPISIFRYRDPSYCYLERHIKGKRIFRHCEPEVERATCIWCIYKNEQCKRKVEGYELVSHYICPHFAPNSTYKVLYNEYHTVPNWLDKHNNEYNRNGDVIYKKDNLIYLVKYQDFWENNLKYYRVQDFAKYRKRIKIDWYATGNLENTPKN